MPYVGLLSGSAVTLVTRDPALAPSLLNQYDLPSNGVSVRLLFMSIVLAFNASYLAASPDVFFIDSDNYGGAYLAHQFHGNNLRFLLTGNILNINLPNRLYDYDALKTYVKDRHVFPSETLRKEFIRMLNMSFYSNFSAKDFLQELLNVLNSFTRPPPGRALRRHN